MNINDLKVGDKVKYETNDGDINRGYFHGYITGYGEYCCVVDGYKIKKYQIISKLEPRPCKFTFRKDKYKEIPIEHNKLYDFKLLSCYLCENKEWGYEYSHKYYCTYCLKSGLDKKREMTLQEYLELNTKINMSEYKNKPAPKKFKFGFKFDNYEDVKNCLSQLTDLQKGKIYTLEIKEEE